MQEDLVVALTRAVKEEVVENYLFNRRVIEEELAEFNERLARVKRYRALVGKRFLRIFGLLVAPPYIKEFIRLIQLERIRPFEFFGGDLNMKQVRLIGTSGFTFHSRYRRLLLEAYERLLHWVQTYNDAYEDLQQECGAVNQNVNWFRREFDLLSIIHFLKSLDIAELERKQFLGGNFSAYELASVESKMVFHPIQWDSLQLPKPLDLPPMKTIKKPLQNLADQVFHAHQGKLRTRIRKS